MSLPAPWWTAAEELAETPRVRWLGIFPRRTRYQEHDPKRVTIPSAQIDAPRLLPAPNDPLPEPETLSLGSQVNHASNLFAPQPPSAGVQRGSVALAEVWLKEEERTASGPSTPSAAQVASNGPQAAGSEQPTEPPLAKRLAYLLQPSADLLLAPEGPMEWPHDLFEFQLDGIRTLLKHEALLLADDMGLGKTIQVIGALRILVLRRQLEQALVIVPAGLVSQWRQELRLWAPEIRVSTVRGPATERAWQWRTPAHVYLIGYETFRSDFTSNPQSPPRRRVWDLVVLDEAQKIKNRETEISRECKLLHRRRSWAVTGTPLENSVDDLASILEFVTPLPPSVTPPRLFYGPDLMARHEKLQLRRRKADVLDQLPPKTVTQLTLSLTGSQLEIYRRAETEGIVQLRAKGETVKIQHVLELITRLKQICNFCPVTGQSSKLADVRERLEILQSEGYRALIFAQFTDEVFGVHKIVSELSVFQPLAYTGGLSPAERDAVIKEFKLNHERKALVLSLRAGGQGLNLQDASYVFHFDRWWNPAVEHQAEDRSHRMGQVVPVHVYKYVCEGTIEEKIDRILREKQQLFNEIVDDVSVDLQSRLSADELFDLFGLTPPASARAARKTGGSPTDFAALSGVEFEGYVQQWLQRLGWRVDLTPPARDGGIDLIARRQDEVGLEKTLYIQCKNHSAPVGVDVVRELNGVLPDRYSGARGVVVCPSGFTAAAAAFAKERGIVLWDRHDLFRLAGIQRPS